jgi:type I restriction enzyme S subunit
VFRTIDGKIYPEYVLAFLKSPLFFKFGIPKMTGTAGQKRVPVEYFATAPFPLAPLAEQKRIVTKIDQLMALCDKLEAERNERNSRQLKVHAAAMAKLFSAPDKQVFNTSWHFITKNFDKLYSVPENVEELKKAILQLAVMGRFSLRNESKVVPLGNIIELISGQHLLANEQNDNGQGIPYLTGPSDFGEKYPVPKRWTETSKAVAEPGDILLTVKGAGVGKTNRLVSEKTAISRQLMAIRVKDADADFVHLILQDAESHFQSTMTGIAIPGIGRRDVLTLKVNLPSPSEQKHIVAITLQLMSLCNALDQQFKNSIAKQAGILDAIISKI